MSHSDDMNILTVLERPSINGERLCHSLSVPVYNIPLFYAVHAVDSVGNIGHVSNIVRAQVTWIHVPSATDDTDSKVKTQN